MWEKQICSQIAMEAPPDRMPFRQLCVEFQSKGFP
uniref:Uncharacterized protein n=1 Tax=Anguilla anguilla TaxID=7936 RepID=A0A0E9PMX8_ANGAN